MYAHGEGVGEHLVAGKDIFVQQHVEFFVVVKEVCREKRRERRQVDGGSKK